MEKIFCDFCNKEVHLSEVCKIEVSEPRNGTNEGYIATSMFDACSDCLKKIRNCMGIKS